ncbi:hypothetical protein C8R43DRAFT_964232 [Mycena crocata]|nr:hypothetical protein C8R43DRAFT_964232 [Mycena crocata]
MSSSHHRSSGKHAQGSSSHPQGRRAAPIFPDPSLGRLIGVPIHICGNSVQNCVKCRMDQSRAGIAQHPIRGSDRGALYHSQINVCVARGRRTPGIVPRELRRRIQNFDFTLQLEGNPRDPGTYVYFCLPRVEACRPNLDQGSLIVDTRRDEEPRSRTYEHRRVLPVDYGVEEPRHQTRFGYGGPERSDKVIISKPYGGAISPALEMERVREQGPTYLIEYMVTAANDTPDQGVWAWYSYFDGSIRVWNWHSTDHSKRAVCVAWKNADDWHWHFDEIVAKYRHAETEVAAVIIIAGMSVFNNQGRSLTMP